MTDDDKELVRRIVERVRRKHYKPPNPDRVTEWAYAVCCEHLISETQLYEWLLNNGECFSSAYRLVYGTPDYEWFGADWRGYARYKRAQGWPLEYVASLVRGWHDRSCVSEIRRLTDEKAAEKQRQHDRDYWRRVQADPAKHDARKAAMRDYYHRNRDKIRRQQNERRKKND